MISEIFENLSDWGLLDTWITTTAALAAMACALPGSFLLLRSQSMMGDALSHTSLLGVAAAFLTAHTLRQWGWVSPESYSAAYHSVMFLGAMATGLLAALLTEWIQQLGRVESSAALGVVFTVLFAIGLVLIRMAADSVDIDPDCVLYGTVETTYVGVGIPSAAIVTGAVLLVNLGLILVFFKELRISAFDPALATSLGINARAMHYALMAVTAATVVAAFESVGVILTIAMLIVPAASAHLLTDRLPRLIALSLVIAALSAVLGHAMAISLPAVVFSRLGFPAVRDASTAGMMAVASGLLFAAAVMFGPRHGVVSKSVSRALLGFKISCEDVLGGLYRLEEGAAAVAGSPPTVGGGRLRNWLATRRLIWGGYVVATPEGYQLTAEGRQMAEDLVRAHRLWESYMARHFALADDHLHNSAARVEHFIGQEMREKLAGELDQPDLDPHGRAIPPEYHEP